MKTMQTFIQSNEAKPNKYVLLMVVLLGSVLLLSACGNSKPHDLDWQVQDFRYTDQQGETFGLADLKNHVWIADLMFTNCTSVCPPMTANLTKLQKRMKNEGVQAEIVSFSVDPARDTPEALAAYIDKFHADSYHWHLLTGYKEKEVQDLAKNTFHSAVQMDPNTGQVAHGTSFYLIDQTGTVVTRYNGLDPDYDKIIEDMRALLE